MTFKEWYNKDPEDRLQDEIIEIKLKLSEANELIVNLLNQAIGEYDKETQSYYYDHSFISAYETALHYCVENNLIKKSKLSRGL
ncbi:hypothetical protein UFOVP610_34 [uncultured Caudovirales phage]|uniref:Uncharacterized protein n=1 Tax=uncultured Caudovirales phage TaxID=2100421 RepID=A0A6J5N3E4_9CAUD|nr:hypothetical protein UFOVP610_34 [uncultured Caudovirales phage]